MANTSDSFDTFDLCCIDNASRKNIWKKAKVRPRIMQLDDIKQWAILERK